MDERMHMDGETFVSANMNVDADSLTHWGVKGMKWGVRRYQNKDGSLTDAGKRRYELEGKDPEAEKKRQASDVDRWVRDDRSNAKNAANHPMLIVGLGMTCLMLRTQLTRLLPQRINLRRSVILHLDVL